ncbi:MULTISPECIES: hypothetical protein [Pseudomonas]|uniref:Uncharacterized protein n=1 Tax=Pseudomonas fluorescens TaxID=294 RepID=A0A162B1X6_PSEFL|nr:MULTISPECIES: hypothetical protein [Pseudomonas]KZN20466.1 hypothetical protein A1D17_02685 [Pseudomonas fluorescens]
MSPQTRILRINVYQSIRKNLFCRLGFHGHTVRPGELPPNVCGWNCGKVFNPNAFQDYVVTLKDGAVFNVRAVNEYHAGSVVVFGPDAPSLVLKVGPSGKFEAQDQPQKVHRDNIASIQLQKVVAEG